MINKLTKLIATGIDLYRGAAAYPASANMKFAQGTIISDATNITANDIVVLGVLTYKFVDTLTGAAFEVFKGASASASLDNLKAAINAAAGAGTTYGLGTYAHPLVTASTKTATTILLIAKTAGKAGNAIATVITSTHLSIASATLTIFEVDAQDMGSIAGEGANQVEFTIVNISDTSAVLTVEAEELMAYPDNSNPQSELIGWVPMFECLAPSSSKAMVAFERTFTGAAVYSISLPKTIADRVHLKIKADKAVTADLYQSIAINQG